MKRIFTKRFFDLSHADQSAVVDAVIQDIESCIGRHLNSADDRKAEKQIERIRRRAVEHGVFSDPKLDGCAKPTKKSDLPGQQHQRKGKEDVSVC
jgi:hypothetical protein